VTREQLMFELTMERFGPPPYSKREDSWRLAARRRRLVELLPVGPEDMRADAARDGAA
jgi:hypothetical protein